MWEKPLYLPSYDPYHPDPDRERTYTRAMAVAVGVRPITLERAVMRDDGAPIGPVIWGRLALLADPRYDVGKAAVCHHLSPAPHRRRRRARATGLFVGPADGVSPRERVAAEARAELIAEELLRRTSILHAILPRRPGRRVRLP